MPGSRRCCATWAGQRIERAGQRIAVGRSRPSQRLARLCAGHAGGLRAVHAAARTCRHPAGGDRRRRGAQGRAARRRRLGRVRHRVDGRARAAAHAVAADGRGRCCAGVRRLARAVGPAVGQRGDAGMRSRRRWALSVRAPGRAGGAARGVRARLRQRRRDRRLLPTPPGRLGRYLDAAVGVRVALAGQMGRRAAAIPACAGHPRGLLQRRRAPVRRAHGAASARTRPRHRPVDDRCRRPCVALRARHARRASDPAMAGPGRLWPHSIAGQQRRVPARARALRSRGRGRCCICSSACASSRLRRRAESCWCSTSKAAGRAWRRTTRRGRWPSRCPSWSSFNVRAACDRTGRRWRGGRLVRQDARVGRLRVASLARRMDRGLGRLAAARTGAIARSVGRRRLAGVCTWWPRCAASGWRRGCWRRRRGWAC